MKHLLLLLAIPVLALGTLIGCEKGVHLVAPPGYSDGPDSVAPTKYEVCENESGEQFNCPEDESPSAPSRDSAQKLVIGD